MNTPWQTLTVEEAITRSRGNAPAGLSEAEAQQRLTQYGPNRLRKEKREPIWEIFLEEIREPMILLLLLTGVLYAVWGEAGDTLVIFAVILTLVAVEVFNEHRAEKAIAGLNKLYEPTAAVRRDGKTLEVPAEQIVPGDMILLQAGRRMAADARLIETYSLAVDESSLTGEAAPVEKDAAVVLPANAALAEQHNLVFAGTTITRGRGSAIVTATGMHTELGRVAALAREAKPPRTPLQQAMRELTRWLVILALGFSVLVPILGVVLSGESPQQMILTGLTLAFATIPEELPIIIAMVLALGAYRLSKRRAIVKRLQAVETLGAVTVIATDKTGTLTENRMEVTRLYPEDRRVKLLEIGLMCNDAAENDGQWVGDPLETALLRAARDNQIDAHALRQTLSLRDEFSFDNTRKRMSAVYQRDGELWIAAKGAPEAVLSISHVDESERQAILATAAQMAHDGLRVIALAEKTADAGTFTQDQAESDLTFVGLAGLADPPRPEVKEAIAACYTAGVRPIMVTGDHPLTASAIAQQIGLNHNGRVLTGTEIDALPDEALHETVGQVDLYARTTPEHKLRIVQALHARGEVVAATGDGINDGPALAAADIGVAMGETGTDVARESADMVLADDNFTTITHAIEEGRVLFANLTKGVRYYLACKVALISVTLLPVLLRVPVPFAPVQIILMELFMDLAASATFVAEPAEAGLMRRKPRDPKAPFMDRAMTTSIFTSAAGLFAAVSVAYLVTWYGSADLVKAQTMAFVTWLLGHVCLALNMRSEREPLFRLGFFSNRLMIYWAGATIIFLFVVMLVPGLRSALKLEALTGGDWALAIGAALIGTFWREARKLISFRYARLHHTPARSVQPPITP